MLTEPGLTFCSLERGTPSSIDTDVAAICPTILGRVFESFLGRAHAAFLY